MFLLGFSHIHSAVKVMSVLHIFCKLQVFFCYVLSGFFHEVPACSRTWKLWLSRCRPSCCYAIHGVPLGCRFGSVEFINSYTSKIFFCTKMYGIFCYTLIRQLLSLFIMYIHPYWTPCCERHPNHLLISYCIHPLLSTVFLEVTLSTTHFFMGTINTTYCSY